MKITAMDSKNTFRLICLFFLLAFFSPDSISQVSPVTVTDSLAIQNHDNFIIPDYKLRLFGSLGPSYFIETTRDTVPSCDLFRKIVFGIDYTFVYSGKWGASLNYKLAAVKYENLPDDYFDDGLRLFTPRDFFEVISLNLIREFSTSNKSLKFGLEAGPSWVTYSVAEIVLNYDYDPEKPFSYMYHKNHLVSRDVGAYFRARIKYMPVIKDVPIQIFGIEFAVFADINKVKPGFGFDLHIIVGNLRSGFYWEKMKREQAKKSGG